MPPLPHSIALHLFLLSTICSIVVHHRTSPIKGWLLFFVDYLSPTSLPSACVVIGYVLLHDPCCPPQTPPVLVAIVQKDEGMIGGGDGDNNVTHIMGEDKQCNY
jgi:hypothetical protein